MAVISTTAITALASGSDLTALTAIQRARYGNRTRVERFTASSLTTRRTPPCVLQSPRQASNLQHSGFKPDASTNWATGRKVAGLGFEPRSTDSESVHLPISVSCNKWWRWGNRTTLTLVMSQVWSPDHFTASA